MPEPDPSTSVASVETRLRSLLMLGQWAQERAALDRAVRAVPADPAEWTDTGITASMWGFTIGEQLTEAVPGLIKDSGERPAVVVARLIREALLLGVEIGRQLERAQPTASSVDGEQRG